ncbi:MAG: hypothetical protein L7F77_02990 [Candidatus Magnetominusculus sp. LBB02]|nr:hypothetical protein [Candidatus Magnetominusculus sp. LBB02]
MSERLSAVRAYIEGVEQDLKEIIRSIDKRIEKARKENDIPIYHTKHRIKSPESTFLKIKKDGDGAKLAKIKDYAGYRILCLFEQDIYRVDEFLYDTFSNDNKYRLCKMKVFNWKTFYDRIKNRKRRGIEIKPEERESGYKSIHYILDCKKEKHFVEIQLRTLVQNVWGELEHHMSYKQGNIHQHIKSSFRMLSEQLGTIDNLMFNLKEIKEKEHKLESFSIRTRGPYFYLCHETDNLPSIFERDPKAAKLYQDYETHMKKRISGGEVAWLNTASRLYGELERLTHEVLSKKGCDAQDKSNIKYWQGIESAYLLFCKGELDEAMRIYEQIRDNKAYSGRYIEHFRLGEIYYIRGEIEKALECFDAGEDILIKNTNDANKQKGYDNYKNIYIIKRKLSMIYWLLGQEYIDIAIQEINEAKGVYDSYKQYRGLFSDKEYRGLINSLCYFYLEKYIILHKKEESEKKVKSNNKAKPKGKVEPKSDDVYDTALSYYNELKNLLLKHDCSSNLYDTLAWFCYQTYLKSGRTDAESLKDAKEYCKSIVEKDNKAILKLTSDNLHRYHIQEIMAAD